MIRWPNSIGENQDGGPAVSTRHHSNAVPGICMSFTERLKKSTTLCRWNIVNQRVSLDLFTVAMAKHTLMSNSR